MARPSLLAGLLASVLLAQISQAQPPISQAQPQNERPVFRTTTAAVTIDVVVRDKSGRSVSGLTNDDFELFEDGEPQRIINVQEAWQQPPDSSRQSSALEPVVEGATSSQAIVAVVFHQLSQQNRTAAVAAARSMVSALRPDEYVGIFALNLTLDTVSPFTRNRAALDGALNRVLLTPSVSLGPSRSDTGVAESGGPPSRYSTPSDDIAAGIRQRMGADAEGSQRSAVQSASLIGIINRLAHYPGRKSIVVFSEGLDVSPRLESVIARAVAENVTVYTIHAAGLSTTGRFSVPDRTVDSRELTSTSRRGTESWRYQFLESDPTAGLGPLARQTGGFLVSDTNALGTALAAVDADRHAYYVLGYSSSNKTVDGTVRHVEVRVKRPGLSVHSRTAYIAAAAEATEAISPDEERARSALAVRPRPHEFDFIVRAYRTPTVSKPYLVSVFVQVPAGALTFEENQKLKRYEGALAVFTRLSKGSTAATAEYQRYRLTGDLARLPDFKQRPLAYSRTVTVPPGSYELEVALLDIVANRVSTIEVPLASALSDEIKVGDLIVVQDIKKATSQKASEHPLGGHREIITPDLTGVFHATPGRSLMLAVPIATARPLAGELSLAGPNGLIRTTAVLLSPPRAEDGNVVQIHVPTAALPAGTYTVTLAIDAGTQPIRRQTTLRITPLPD